MTNQNVLDALKVVTEALTAPVATTVQAEELTKHTVSEGEYFVMVEANHGWFSWGDVIKLTRKDGTESPAFTDAKGLMAYVHLPRLRRATPDEVAEAFPDTKAFADVKLIDGNLYEKVDEKAAIGDYICYDEIDRSYLTDGKLYEVIKFDCGDEVIVDDDGDNFDTYSARDFDVYKPVKNEAPPADDHFVEIDGLRYAKFEGELRVGDYITASYDFGDIALGKKYEVFGVDSDGDGYIHDDDGCTRFVDADRIQAIYRRALSEREKSFVKFGREVDEFKVGDIVQIIQEPTNGNGYNVVGSIHEIDSLGNRLPHLKKVTPRQIESNTYTEFNDIKLIAPVERLK
ncbi:hypothetical protein HB904_04240 [Listeria booriae]|uniref:Uncharacterized protein n=1 Tax=Listeria booriae TaxID=1552123 RepID=A0A842AC30_9LIST|nr:hypothetical protein [Listeria booriae]MBC1615383.1 hypothetical protein [Listeria booriae]